jgi:hypothetical protein
MWEGIGSAIGGLFGYKGTKQTNVASAQQAQKQMDFQREMSNTAVQRRMRDLTKAGINPILAGTKEASSPAGAMAPVMNKAQVAMNTALNAANLENTMANTLKTEQETTNLKAKQSTTKGEFEKMSEALFKWIKSGNDYGDAAMYPMTNSLIDLAKSLGKKK